MRAAPPFLPIAAVAVMLGAAAAGAPARSKPLLLDPPAPQGGLPPGATPTGKPPPLGAALPGPAGAPPVAGVRPPQLAGLPAAKPPPAPAGPPGAPRDSMRPVASGTGFVVAPGRLLTNHHVADGCAEMRARTASGTEMRATVTASDRQRDLALLVVQDGGDPGPPLAFRRGPEIRRGEGVVTYGFPLAGLLSSGPTLTTGEVSALAGLGDDPRQFQISAPVQPGNSGGPLLDMSGHVVGVVVGKLNAQRVAQRIGDIPQNVNFAVKGEQAIAFLRRHGIEPRLADSVEPLRSAAEVGDIAHPSTVFLRCMR
jgi:S1-C subfamily serine protease